MRRYTGRHAPSPFVGLSMSRSLVARALGRLRQRADPVAPSLDPPSVERSANAEPAIFVIGCQRSGTSLVRRILDSHSRIACPAESRFLLTLLSVLEDDGAMRGLQGMGYERPAVAAALRAFAGSFFQRYAAAAGKARWADKTPQYVDLLDPLWEVFGPEARFVMVFRDGMDVAFSLADPNRAYPAIDPHVRQAGGDVPAGAARFWAAQNQKIDGFRHHHPEACVSVRYEDLTTDPGPVLKQMFGFLGEPWEPAVVDYARFPHHGGGFEDPDVRRRRSIEPNSGRWRAWPDPVQVRVREACEPMLARLGYG